MSPTWRRVTLGDAERARQRALPHTAREKTIKLLGYVVVLVAVLGCGTLPPNPPTDPGREAAERAVGAYITALNSNDPARVAAVTGKDAADAVERVQRFGGRGLHDVNLSLSSEFQRVYSVTIAATDAAGGTVSWRETIEWNGVSWDFAPLANSSNSNLRTTS